VGVIGVVVIMIVMAVAVIADAAAIDREDAFRFNNLAALEQKRQQRVEGHAAGRAGAEAGLFAKAGGDGDSQALAGERRLGRGNQREHIMTMNVLSGH
jgi:hypothetical protein